MGFQQGLSGLNASSKDLDVIGNNVANANTVGFKESQAQFADVYAASLSGSGSAQIGLGTRLETVAQQFVQGNITVTNNTLDTAINGKGFFRMDNNGAVTFTRNGQFQLDKNGFIVNGLGHKLTGYAANASGVIITATPVPLQIPTADLMPLPTANIVAGMNLDARSAVPITALFNPADPTSYNNSTSTTIYDSLGNNHIATLYFQKAPPPATNTWNTYLTIDNAQVSLGAAPANQLVFNTSGILTAPAGGLMTSAAFTPTGAAAQTLTLNFSTTTQFGSAFGVTKLSQDGYASGRMNGFSIGSDGVIQGRYTNGQSKAIGQVALANFSNPQGLQPLGGNEWSDTAASGSALVGAPGSGSLGVLQSAAVEDSTVDLTAELVNMITAQRVYQANAQTIKTEDAMLQTLVNLR